jgi:hypothetical protein
MISTNPNKTTIRERKHVGRARIMPTTTRMIPKMVISSIASCLTPISANKQI